MKHNLDTEKRLLEAEAVIRAVVDKDHIDIGWGKAAVMALEYERKYPEAATTMKHKIQPNDSPWFNVLLECKYDDGVSRTRGDETAWESPRTLLYIAQFTNNYVYLTGNWKQVEDKMHVVVGFTLL